MVLRRNVYGWVILAAMAGLSMALLPWKFTAGVVAGGLLVTLNLQLLHRFAARALRPGAKIALKRVLFKYYLRFAITILLIVLLMWLSLVHPLGLLVGLSVFILDVFVVVLEMTGRVIYRRITKEAV